MILPFALWELQSEQTPVLGLHALALMVLKTLETMGPLHGYGIARRIEQTSGDRLVRLLAVQVALAKMLLDPTTLTDKQLRRFSITVLNGTTLATSTSQNYTGNLTVNVASGNLLMQGGPINVTGSATINVGGAILAATCGLSLSRRRTWSARKS